MPYIQSSTPDAKQDEPLELLVKKVPDWLFIIHRKIVQCHILITIDNNFIPLAPPIVTSKKTRGFSTALMIIYGIILNT